MRSYILFIIDLIVAIALASYLAFLIREVDEPKNINTIKNEMGPTINWFQYHHKLWVDKNIELDSILSETIEFEDRHGDPITWGYEENDTFIIIRNKSISLVKEIDEIEDLYNKSSDTISKEKFKLFDLPYKLY